MFADRRTPDIGGHSLAGCRPVPKLAVGGDCRTVVVQPGASTPPKVPPRPDVDPVLLLLVPFGNWTHRLYRAADADGLTLSSQMLWSMMVQQSVAAGGLANAQAGRELLRCPGPLRRLTLLGAWANIQTDGGLSFTH